MTTFEYTISDGNGGEATGTVTVTVTTNTLPTAQPDAVTTNQGNPVEIDCADLLANDTDPDVGDVLAITAVDNAVNGEVELDEVNGIITFTPADGFTGDAHVRVHSLRRTRQRGRHGDRHGDGEHASDRGGRTRLPRIKTIPWRSIPPTCWRTTPIPISITATCS